MNAVISLSATLTSMPFLLNLKPRWQVHGVALLVLAENISRITAELF